MWRYGIFSLWFVLSGVSAADSTATPHFIVGVEDTRYFPQYDHEGMVFLGYARDFFDEFARQQNIEFEYRIFPINRLYQHFLVEQDIDFKYPDAAEWRPDLRTLGNVFYSAPCAAFTDGVMVLPRHLGRPLTDLKSLGIVRGFTAVGYEQRVNKGLLTLDDNGNTAGLLQMVLRERVQGAYINIDVARYHLRQVLQQPDALVYDPGLPHFTSAYHLATIKHPKRIAELNAFIEANREWIQNLKNRYHIEEH